VGVYKVWHTFLPHFPKTARYTLGEKIDALFIRTIEYIFTASHLYKTEKLPYIKKAISSLDLLKFFLQVAWEIKALDNKKYLELSKHLNEISKMLGGWIRQVSKENPAN